MAWTVEQAKTYLGIDPGDTSKDAAIQQVLDYTLHSVELVLQRKLPLARETVTFYAVSGPRVLLPRYPISTVFSINGADPREDLQIHGRVGWIEHPEFWGADELKVDYEGGYAVFPEALERALWEAFLQAWSNSDETTGGPVPGTGGVIEGSGEVSSVTLSDFGTVRFDVGATAVADAASGASTIQNWGWLAPWASVLGYYRSESGAELGMA